MLEVVDHWPAVTLFALHVTNGFVAPTDDWYPSAQV